MKKTYPCVEINLNKVSHNTKTINELCKFKGIDVVGISKVYCAQKPIVQAMLDGGLNAIGDSRIENLKRIKDFNCTKILLRIPMQSQVAEVVKYADISLNSELKTIQMLSKAAKRINKVHDIILMIDLGDLREGILEKDVMETVQEIVSLPNVRLCGIGTNLTCYGGVIPDEDNLGRLTKIKDRIEESFGLTLSIVSGGNSSSLYTLNESKMPKGVNQLRIGEAIVLGRETAFGKDIEKCYKDSFLLKGEIIEVKEKPSVPIGNIGMDAFGNTPSFIDKGIIRRAIIAIGRQDITSEGLTPIDERIEVIGASSDHLILDITNCDESHKVGDIIEFTLDYGCLLRVMTSMYVNKYYV